MDTANNPRNTTGTQKTHNPTTNPCSTTPVQANIVADTSDVIEAEDPIFGPKDPTARIRPMDMSTLPVGFTVNHANF